MFFARESSAKFCVFCMSAVTAVFRGSNLGCIAIARAVVFSHELIAKKISRWSQNRLQEFWKWKNTSGSLRARYDSTSTIRKSTRIETEAHPAPQTREEKIRENSARVHQLYTLYEYMRNHRALYRPRGAMALYPISPRYFRFGPKLLGVCIFQHIVAPNGLTKLMEPCQTSKLHSVGTSQCHCFDTLLRNPPYATPHAWRRLDVPHGSICIVYLTVFYSS